MVARRFTRSVFALLGGLAVAGFIAPITLRADEPKAAASAPAAARAPYIRIVEDEKAQTVTLELAIRTFKPKKADGPLVHLVSAIHIADASFYAAMQRYLDEQSVVLFEGVRPPGTSPVPPDADDAARAKITRARLGVLGKLGARSAAGLGRVPQTVAEIIEVEPRWKYLLEPLTHDGWGRAITIRVNAAPTDHRDGSPLGEATATLVSLGSDGKAGGEEGTPAADLESAIAFTPSSPAPDADGKPAPKAPADANIQKQMAEAMGLTFQLDAMDTTKPNYLNSDMSVDEVQERIGAAGGDAQALLGMLDGSSGMAKLASFGLSIMKSMPGGKGMLKAMIVEMLGNAESLMGGEGGAKVGPMAAFGPAMKVILHDRNQVVVRDVKRLLEEHANGNGNVKEEKKGGAAAKRPVQSIAAFYGAGHMGALEKQLVDELGLEFVSERWTPAVTLTPENTQMPYAQLQATRRQVRGMIEMQMKMGGAAPKKKAE